MPGLTLVIDTQNRKLVRGFTSTIDAQIPALFQGDTIDPLNLRFVAPTGISGAPYADVDYSDAFVQVGIGVIGTKPTGGTWTLTDTGAAQTTAAMAYGATAVAVQSAIRAALTTNWPLAVVTGGDGGPYIITNGSNGAESLLSAGASLLTPVSSVDISTVQDGDTDKPEIQYVLLTQSPIAYQDDFSAVAAPTVSVTEIADGGVGQNEIQLVTLTGSPYSGSFSLVFDDGDDSESSDLIAWNATAAEVQEILEAVVLIGAGNVSVAGDAGGPWTITFIGDLAATSFDLMTSANTLVGPLMVTSDLGLNTGSIDEDIGETASITRTFSIKVTPLGGLPSTVAQVNCTIFNDLIRGAITIPTPGPSYLTAAEVYALLANYLPLDGSEPMTGDLDMDGNKILNSDLVTGPASSSDAALALFDGTNGKLLQNSALTYSLHPAGEPMLSFSGGGLNVLCLKNTDTSGDAYSGLTLIYPETNEQKGTIATGKTNVAGRPWESVYIESWEGASADGNLLPIRFVQTRQTGGYKAYVRMECQASGSLPGDVVFYGTADDYPDSPVVVRIATGGDVTMAAKLALTASGCDIDDDGIRLGYASPAAKIYFGFLSYIRPASTLTVFSKSKDGQASSFEGFKASGTTYYIGADGDAIVFQGGSNNALTGTDRARIDLTTGAFEAGNFKRGTGDPNSVVTGAVGDLYTRTDGGTGSTLYVKESGAGTNTGWVAK